MLLFSEMMRLLSILFSVDERMVILRYFVPQVPISGKFLNGYPMFSVNNSVQNVKRIELLGKKLVPLHFVISKSSFF